MKAIEENLQQIRGLARIATTIERTDKEIDDKDTTILKRRVGSSKGLTMYHFWDSLIASRASAVEHINGTKVQGNYSISPLIFVRHYKELLQNWNRWKGRKLTCLSQMKI